MHFVRRTALVCALALVAAGCAAAPRATTTAGPRSGCTVAGAGATPPDSISIGASSAVDPSRVPVPGNEAERFVFAQLYETLINVDCEGRAYPGLAKSWTLDATRTRVTLVIRDDARFSDAKPVVAADVVAAWRATGAQSNEASRLARKIVDGTTVVDDRTMTVSLPDSSWRALADPALAVYRPQSGPAWAVGTAAYDVAAVAPGSGPRRLVLAPLRQAAAPALVIQSRTNDARDAIDRGVDVLVTEDPLALAYAQSHSAYATVPLPWSRTYVLAIPSFAGADSTLLRHMAADSTTEFRASLARDAVRVEARAAEAPYWWSYIQGCGSPATSAARQSGPKQRVVRIAYDARDRVARRLAERLIALDTRAVAAPLAPEALAIALRDGSEAAYVIALPRLSLDVCHSAIALFAAAPWIIPGASDSQSSTGSAIVPLVETRARAIVNRDRVSAAVDWDGTLRFGGTMRAP